MTAPVRLLLAVLAPVLLAGGVRAQFGEPPLDTALYTRVEDGVVRAAIEFDIERGWHLYHTDTGHPDAIGLPTRITFEGGGVAAWSAPRFPEPNRYDQSDIMGPGVFIYGHEGRVVAYATGRLEEGASGADVQVEIRGQVCDEACINFTRTLASEGAGPDALFEPFPADLTPPAPGEPPAEDAPGDGGPPGAGGPAAGKGEVDAASGAGHGTVEYPAFAARREASEHGLALWLLLAFVAGVILNVMPCVLPVISIKVLSFVQQAGESRKRVLQLGLSFAAGIFVVFLLLAGAAIGAGLSWGEQFQSDEFLVMMIAVVFALALSLFGVFELGVPSGVGALSGLRREGLGDAFFKGMLATVLATPCSGPFLGTTLTWTLAQPPHVVLLVFTMLGVGMASPYVLLTAFPRLLKLVPRPGPWMETFKQAMGFLLLGTVVWLMISVRQDNLLFTLAFLVFVGIGAWWWGRFPRLDQSVPKRLGHLAVALGIVAAGARISFVDFKGLFETDESHVAWVDFEPAEFLGYLDQGRNVFVDFTADWCPNCKYNEVFVYNSEEVRGLLAEKDVVPLKADMTDDAPEIEALLEQLGARSIPFMAVFPGDDPREPYVLPDVVTVAQVVQILEACPDPGVPAPPPE